MTMAKLDLEGLRYHACTSGTSTPPMVREQILAACAEIDRLTAKLAHRERELDAWVDAVSSIDDRDTWHVHDYVRKKLGYVWDGDPGAPKAEPAAVQSRTDRQLAIHAWARAAFGEEQATSLPQRATRLLEEAIELYQACGGSPAMIGELRDYIFEREVGEVGQEIGGVSVCLLALAAAAGLSADAEELREVERVLGKPIEEFTKRNAAKNAAGFLATKSPIVVPESTWTPCDGEHAEPDCGAPQCWLRSESST